MFERFTKRVETIFDLARKEAIKYGHNKIETEHLLLAIIEEGQGIAIGILHYQGIDPEKVKADIQKSMKIGVPLFMATEIPLSSQTKKILELAVKEAQALGHSYIGTEHLLLGTILEDNLAARVLARFGLTPQKTHQALEELLADPEKARWHDPSKAAPAQQHRPKVSAVDMFGKDLTKLAREGKMDPVIGRESEIERVTQILCRRKKNNPVLLGEAGVGKTAIIEGFAQQIATGKVPEILKHKRIVLLDLAAMVAGTKYRGEFEQRIKTVLDEIKNSQNIIIFIDEIHTMVGAGGAEGAIDASNILNRPSPAEKIQCVGATTIDEYRKYIEKDAALERRFQPVIVNPPTPEETMEILRGVRGKYEAHHHLKISDDALEAAVKMSDRYIPDRHLPDKAIDLIDEASSHQRLKLSNPPAEMGEIESEVEKITRLKEEMIRNQDFERAAALRDRERGLKNRLDFMREHWERMLPEEARTITRKNIAEIVSQWTKIPVTQLCKEEKERLLEMEKALAGVVIGQAEGISAVSRAIRRTRAGLKDRNRPIGSFLFLGPTGVGKTLLARALAEFLFGDEQALIQVDMSEYMEKFATSRLVGAPPGYVGYEEGGQLTERVRRRPYSVVLLDEIEKAHPDVFNLLLQMLEEGRLTDSFGRAVSFRNTVIILTSNLGTQIFKNQSLIGFQQEEADSSYERLKTQILEEARRAFRPELLNRLDETIVFRPLTTHALLSIVDLELAKVSERLKEQNLALEVSPEAKLFLIQQGTNAQYGARPLRRTISRYLEDPLSEELLHDRFPEHATVVVDRKDDTLSFTPKKGAPLEQKTDCTTVTST